VGTDRGLSASENQHRLESGGTFRTASASGEAVFRPVNLVPSVSFRVSGRALSNRRTL